MTEDLRKAAEAATPGPWFVCSDLPVYAIGAESGYRVVQTANQNNSRKFGPSEPWHGISSARDAAFIALANPAAILALLDERDAAIKEADEAHAAVTAERDALRIALQRLESAASSMLVGVGVHNDRHAARVGSRIEGPVVLELADATRSAGITLKEKP